MSVLGGHLLRSILLLHLQLGLQHLLLVGLLVQLLVRLKLLHLLSTLLALEAELADHGLVRGEVRWVVLAINYDPSERHARLGLPSYLLSAIILRLGSMGVAIGLLIADHASVRLLLGGVLSQLRMVRSPLRRLLRVLLLHVVAGDGARARLSLGVHLNCG